MFEITVFRWRKVENSTNNVKNLLITGGQYGRKNTL